MADSKTKVIHSKSKDAWNILGTQVGKKYKLVIVPYVKDEGNKSVSLVNKNEALRHAEYIRFCLESYL